MKKHLGILDPSGKPYAKYWNPKMAPLPAHAHEALALGPVAAELLPEVGNTSDLENGYGLWPDGSLHVAIRTDLPNVDFKMIAWWFAWHSDEPERYKLWHPRAHVHAEWKDAGSGYLNRTSLVDEYIGSELSHVEISFREPPIPDSIFARIGMSQLEVGWLLHEIRDGKMFSRFWIGGRFGQVRGLGKVGGVLARAIGRFVKPGQSFARDLLVHCSQEMSHLGSFLPSLYEEYAL